MEYLPNGFSLEISPGAFPLSTDSMALSHFVRLPRNPRVLDLGSGCGTLGLLLCSQNPVCRVTGVELEENAHLCATENILRNQLHSRMESICADLREIPKLFSPGSYDIVVSNPPYFSGGPASMTLPDARKETCCTMPDLMRSAGWALKYGGDFFLVHRPERLAEIILRAGENAMEAKRLLLLRHRQSGPVSLILLQFRKGGKPGLQIEEAALFDAGNNPTDYYKAIYHQA